MIALSEHETCLVQGGGDGLATDIGQFVGGTVGFAVAHPLLVSIASLLLPFGVGGFAITVAAGLNAAGK